MKISYCLLLLHLLLAGAYLPASAQCPSVPSTLYSIKCIGSVGVPISAGASGSWTVSTTETWLHLAISTTNNVNNPVLPFASSKTHTGSAMVVIAAKDYNQGTSNRSATVSIRSGLCTVVNITVTQTPTSKITAVTTTVPVEGAGAAGGQYVLAIQSNAAWTISLPNVSWFSLAPGASNSGKGQTQVPFVLAANTASQTRTTPAITVRGECSGGATPLPGTQQTFTVKQAFPYNAGVISNSFTISNRTTKAATVSARSFGRYHFYFKTVTDAIWIYAGSSTQNFTFNNLTPGVKYCFRVEPYKDNYTNRPGEQCE